MSQGVTPKTGSCHRGVGSRDTWVGQLPPAHPPPCTALCSEGSSLPMEEQGHTQAHLYPLLCPPSPSPSPSPATSIPASVKAGGGLHCLQGTAPCQKPPLHGALPMPALCPCTSPAEVGTAAQPGRAMPACLGEQPHGHCCIFHCCFWSIKHWICWVAARGHGQGTGAVGSTPSPAHLAQAPPLHKHACPTSVTLRVYLTPHCPGRGVPMAAASREGMLQKAACRCHTGGREGNVSVSRGVP